METTLKILIRKKFFLLFFLLFFTQLSFTQSIISKDNYREDQFYFGSSYFIQTEPIKSFKQNGFSGNFQFGFIRDFPLNNNSTKAIGLGLGYERNFFTSNIQPIETNDNIDYRIVISRFLESKNKIVSNLGSSINSHLDESSVFLTDDLIFYTSEDKLDQNLKSEIIIGELVKKYQSNIKHHYLKD